MVTINDIKAMILGHAIGDALGVPVEFQTREELRENPVEGMRGAGTYDVTPGAWSDDTSMTLALLESLGRLGRIDYEDIMRNFIRWADEAAFTSTGFVFDMGHTTMQALMKFKHGTVPLECGGMSDYDNGNGSLMRIAPLALYLYSKYGNHIAENEPMDILHRVSSLTHGHAKSKMACGIYGNIVAEILSSQYLKPAIRNALQRSYDFYRNQEEFEGWIDVYEHLWNVDEFVSLPERKIKSSGYVVDTLEAVVWCLYNTSDYGKCVLQAVNLGDDTDTVAAIAGGLAGLFYGYDSLPQEWLEILLKRNEIETLCESFFKRISKLD